MNQDLPRLRPVVLCVLDGWGHRVECDDNAICQAKPRNWERLMAECPHGLLDASELHVGLPEGQMGNSEVGHMNIGAGRVVMQELPRIDKAMADRAIPGFPAFKEFVAKAKAGTGTVHLMGLLSPGGVHSHEAHLFAMLELARRERVPQVAVHAFLDGRDMPPKSAEPSLRALQAACAENGHAAIASVCGRYYAMDRDQRWDRVRRAWDAIVDARSELHVPDALLALEEAYARGETDEFVLPTVIGDGARVEDGDAVVFMNFRADRARQLAAAFVDPAFRGFDARRPQLARFACLSEYDARLPASVAFAPDDLHDTLGELLAEAGLTQLRIAETEKYAHVTFFFSGGRETPFVGEERILVPSPKVATYDLQPAMSLPELTARLVDAIGSDRFDVIVCNIANPDMVGHSGDLQAAILAAQAVDIAVGAVDAAVRARHGALIITADHGNLEMMRDPLTGQPHTAHTVGPVPLVYVGERVEISLRSGGALRDVAPTLLDLLGLPQPAEMSGRSLFDAAQ